MIKIDTKHTVQTMSNRRLCGFLLIFFLLTLSIVPIYAQEADVTVDASTIIAEVGPFVYGANLGPFAVPPGLFEEAAQSGIRFLRFPHGEWGDQNDLSEFNIDLFIKMAALIGAEPSIAVRLRDGTPEKAAELVRYTNIEQAYDVQYWYVGNEPNLYGNEYTTEIHNQEWRAIALAMLEVDPDITLIGPGISQWNGITVDPDDSQGNNWLVDFLEANGDLVDIVSVHRYPFPESAANPNTSIDDIRDSVSEWDEILPNLRQVILDTTGRDDYPVGITEFNSHWGTLSGGEATNDSFTNALFVAEVLGRSLQHEPFTLGYFDYSATSKRGGGGLTGEFDVIPAYYTYQLYQRFGTQVIETHSSIQYLSVYGALREDGALTLIAVNFGDNEVSAKISITGFDGQVTSTRLLTESILAEEVTDVLLDGETLTMPAMSAALFILE